MPRLNKFRRSPDRFFADSQHGLIRSLGDRLKPLMNRSAVRDGLLDPATAIANSELVIAAGAMRRLQEMAARHRRALLTRRGQPRISIVMAAWNATETIEAAIGSLRLQTYSNFELIVVDDASTDDTTAKVAALAKTDKRIRLVCSAQNRGAAAARNIGLAAAHGEFVTFQDSDDTCLHDRLERQLYALVQSGSGVVVCICNYQRVDSLGRVQSINGKRTMKARISMLFPRERVMSRLGYFEDLIVGEDSEYFERMLIVFGPQSVVEVLKPLYRASFSPDSLLFGDGKVERISETEVCHSISETSDLALSKARQRHHQMRAGTLSAFVGASRRPQ